MSNPYFSWQFGRLAWAWGLVLVRNEFRRWIYLLKNNRAAVLERKAMTKDKTVTMSRELAERILRNGLWPTEADELRALLAAPVVESQPDAYLYIGGPVDHDRIGKWLGFSGKLSSNWKPEDVTIKPLYTSPPAPVAEKYDDVLNPFVALMRKELHANADKGDRPGWLSMSSDTALLEIIYHFGKLQASVKRGDEDGIREYAADVANMCMMLTDVCACLDKVKELNQ